MEVAVRTPWAFSRATPNVIKSFHFVDMAKRYLCSAEPCDCAAPRPLPTQCRPTLALVQRRPSCPCSADPVVMTLTHWAHPTPFPLAVPTQLCARRCKIWIRELICVEGVFADCDQPAKHSLSWWQSGLPKQHSKVPHTQCIKYVFRKRD